jgi:hypothetical protein
MANDIEVELDQGTVYCRPDKGNYSAARNDPVVWGLKRPNAGILFRLVFRREPCSGKVTQSDGWPFSNPPKPNGPLVTAWGTQFTGTVRADLAPPVVFEYTVEIVPVPADGAPVSSETEVYTLDPMFIVGR